MKLTVPFNSVAETKPKPVPSCLLFSTLCSIKCANWTKINLSVSQPFLSLFERSSNYYFFQQWCNREAKNATSPTRMHSDNVPSLSLWTILKPLDSVGELIQKFPREFEENVQTIYSIWFSFYNRIRYNEIFGCVVDKFDACPEDQRPLVSFSRFMLDFFKSHCDAGNSNTL